MSDHLPESSLWHPSQLNKVCITRKDSESEWLAKGNLEANPITIKTETVSHMAEQFSWLPLHYFSPPGGPFPIKFLALPAHVSPWTIHFRVLDKSPVSGRGRGTLPAMLSLCLQLPSSLLLSTSVLIIQIPNLHAQTDSSVPDYENSVTVVTFTLSSPPFPSSHAYCDIQLTSDCSF